MHRSRARAIALLLATGVAAATASAQTGSFWVGRIDANIPVDFYAEQFTADRIEGRMRFGAARYGFADINRLCDTARFVANRQGEHYAYRVSGRCGGQGTIRVTAHDPDRLEGRGTLFDAAAASGRKRRHFYLDRQ